MTSKAEEQQERSQILLAYNYALNVAGLPALAKAIPFENDFLVKCITDLPASDARKCPYCTTRLQADDSQMLVAHNKPDCLQIFHEACFIQAVRTLGACPACTPTFTIEQLIDANNSLMDRLDSASDLDATLQHMELFVNATVDNATQHDQDVFKDAYYEYQGFEEFEGSGDDVALPETTGTASTYTYSSANLVAGEDDELSEASAALWSIFPDGFNTVQTSGDGLLCALHAIHHSLAALAENDLEIPVPTVEDLQAVTKTTEFEQSMAEFSVDGDLMNENYFAVDQAALAAQMWAENEYGFAIRLGYVTPDTAPVLLTYQPLNADRVMNAESPQIYFIHNDNVEARFPGTMNHFEGLRATAPTHA